MRATTHTSSWFSRIEELNDYVIYVADPAESGWTRQCCRQADVILGLGLARAEPQAMAGQRRPALRSPAAHASSSLLLHEGDILPPAPPPAG